VRWRLIDLAQWVFDAFRVSISKQTLSRELRAMGFRKLSARPRYHAKDEEAAAALGSRRTTGLRQTDRDLVPRRGSGRAEEQNHSPMGETWNQALCAA
jgi:hypothetical protein